MDSAHEAGRKKYRVKLQGKVGEQMNSWFDGLSIAVENDSTILTGEMRDQAELHGLLRKIHDLHLTLISVETLS